MAHSRIGNVKHRMVSVLALVFLFIGCSTSNDENWAITSPNDGDTIPYSNMGVTNVDVSGTADVGDSDNYVDALDAEQGFSLTSMPESVTSASGGDHTWSKTLGIRQFPQTTGPTIRRVTIGKASIATGSPNPNLTGADITKHALINIELRRETS